MKNKETSLAQAYKLYTGTNIAKFIIKTTVYTFILSFFFNFVFNFSFILSDLLFQVFHQFIHCGPDVGIRFFHTEDGIFIENG